MVLALMWIAKLVSRASEYPELKAASRGLTGQLLRFCVAVVAVE